MKNLIATILLLSLSVSTFCQVSGDHTRTISYDLNHDGKEILLNVGCDVEISEWKGNVVRIYININFRNHDSNLIKELVKMKRYDLSTSSGQDQVYISVPNLDQIVKINGTYLKEDVNFKVLIPEQMKSYIHSTGDLAITGKQQTRT